MLKLTSSSRAVWNCKMLQTPVNAVNIEKSGQCGRATLTRKTSIRSGWSNNSGSVHRSGWCLGSAVTDTVTNTGLTRTRASKCAHKWLTLARLLSKSGVLLNTTDQWTECPRCLWWGRQRAAAGRTTGTACRACCWRARRASTWSNTWRHSESHIHTSTSSRTWRHDSEDSSHIDIQLHTMMSKLI